MKYWIVLLLSIALFAGCNTRDIKRIELAETLMQTNRDSAEVLLRQVERPGRLDDVKLSIKN